MGSAEIVRAANNIVQSVLRVLLKFIIPTGMVLNALSSTNTKANINSFHTDIAAKSAEVAKIGLLIGKTILQNTLQELQPSIYAESSISRGIVSIYDLIKNVVNGILKAIYGIIIAQYVL